MEAGEAIVAPTLLPGWPPTVQPFHWIVYDKSGKSLVIEPIGGKLVVTDNPSACSPIPRRSIGT